MSEEDDAAPTMSEAEEQRAATMAARRCNFCCLFVFTAAAVACGVGATGYCAFVKRNIVLKPQYTVASVCDEYASNAQQCQSWLTDQSIGFYGFQVTVPLSNTQYCLSYTQPTRIGYVTLQKDTKFNAASAFTYVANFFGLVAFFTLAFASCCPLNASRMAGLSLYFFLATLFQGLTLLILQSNACRKGFFEPFFASDDSFPDHVIDRVYCSLDVGSKMVIAATVLYFWCMLTAPAAHPPPPMMMMTGRSQQQQPPAAAAAAQGEGEQQQQQEEVTHQVEEEEDNKV